jgi:lysophospholipase L1-like esterase
MRGLSFGVGAVLFLLNFMAAPAHAEGLGRTWKKIEQSHALTIGYFGGSITEGAGASNAAVTSWRALTTAWFRQQFPVAKITEVNAAIGGTGSDLGAFRCQRDLLSKKPDLVFIEFAVNDFGATDARAAFYEGIVRQILRANPAADIVLVYTVSKAADSYPQGVVPHTVAYEQKIADHYDLPSVNIGQALSRAMQQGQGTWLTLSKDTTHPNDAGYRICEDAMIAFLQAHRQDVAELPAPIPAPLNPDPVENPAMIDAWTLRAPGWTRETQSLAGRFPHRLSAEMPGTALDLPFHGTEVGVYWLVAPDSGSIDYSIDQGPVKTLSAWDRYALQFTRAASVLLAENLPPGEHVLHLKISATKAAKSTGTWIRIGAFLVR